MTDSILSGTWPVRMHADRFFGTVKVDGQHPRVAGLATYRGDVIALSLVGYDTSVSAVLASLWSGVQVSYLVGDQMKWDGPRSLRRRNTPYKQYSVQLEGTKEVHAMALVASANIAEGIFHPPDLPCEQDGKRVPFSSPTSDARSRFVLGNWDEPYPNERSFLGTLYGMRVLFLHKDDEHPDWPGIWARELWQRGCLRKLIEPLKDVVGMKVWVLSGDLQAWGKLIGDGTREGWLPWCEADNEQEEGELLTVHAMNDALVLSGVL